MGRPERLAGLVACGAVCLVGRQTEGIITGHAELSADAAARGVVRAIASRFRPPASGRKKGIVAPAAQRAPCFLSRYGGLSSYCDSRQARLVDRPIDRPSSSLHCYVHHSILDANWGTADIACDLELE